MNKEIKVMIELQQYWDVILSSKGEIERSNKSIKFWENEISDKKKELVSLEEQIKKFKNDIKKNELNLSDIENKIIKLNERRSIIKTEKELTALNHEIDALKKDQGNLEEKILILMEDLDNLENNESNLKKDIDESEKQFEIDRVKLEEKISSNEEKILKNQKEFDDLLADLSGVFKAKFTKLLNAKGGKAITKLEGDTCGNCNCQIPASLAIDASKGEKVTNCTNCGRYIY